VDPYVLKGDTGSPLAAAKVSYKIRNSETNWNLHLSVSAGCGQNGYSVMIELVKLLVDALVGLLLLSSRHDAGVCVLVRRVRKEYNLIQNGSKDRAY
jgi:hypothetical protein